MVVVSTREVDRMSTHNAGSVIAHSEAGSMSDLGGCKVADAAGTTAVKATAAKATAVKTATMTATVATTVAVGSECYGPERQAAERENCSQRKD
jgi:hypothetical protein